jgi:hypothetical protein
MANFCPEGYLPTPASVVCAAQYWFPDKVAAIESAMAGSQVNSKSDFETAVKVFSQPAAPDPIRRAFEEIATQTVNRLRNSLHQSELKAYYFTDDGRYSVSPEFWATPQADGVLEAGIYWPFGKPFYRHESRPNYPLFLLQSELNALLSEPPAKKRPFPKAKMPDLVAALRTLDHLPTRDEQREALRNLPEFAQYQLTDDVLREAEKQVPRKPGRKPRIDR